jgi:hypothetical protein
LKTFLKTHLFFILSFTSFSNEGESEFLEILFI